MRWLRLGGCILLANLLAAGGLRAAIIADYQADYLTGTANGQTRPAVSADGWDYMYNSGGAIGTAANYTSLKWWSTSNHYNYDGAGNLPRAAPASYVNLSGSGGHPPQGSTQTATERYGIAAYTAQAAEGLGLFQLTNTNIHVASSSSNGVEVRTYVNNALIGSTLCPGNASRAFDAYLGWLSPTASTVYVAMGPNTADGNDSFDTFRFQIAHAPATCVTWDADGAAPVGGTGTWDTASAQWAAPDGLSYSAWSNAGNLNANFAGTAGTVTVGEPVTARSLSFATTGYTVDGASALTLTNAGADGPGAATIWVPSSADTATISAPLAGTAGLAKTGLGTLQLAGAAANTLSGVVAVNQGTLQLNKSAGTDAIPAGGLTLASSALGTAVARLLANEQISNAAPIVLNANGGYIAQLDLNANTETIGALTMSSTTNASATLRLGSTGVLNLTTDIVLNNNRNATGNTGREVLITGTGTYGTAGAGGFIDLGGGARTITVNSNNTQANNYATVEGVISNGSLVKAGTAALVLGASNTFTGGLTINAGTVIFTTNANVGPDNNPILINGGRLDFNGSADWNPAASRTITIGASGGTLGGSRKIYLNDTNQLAGAGTLTKAGSNTLQLGAANAGFTGNWIVSGGQVEVQNTGALGPGTISVSGGELVAGNLAVPNSITIASGTVSSDGGNNSAFTGPITANGSFNVGLRDFWATATPRNLTISSTLSGAGGMTLVGPTSGSTPGTLILSADTSGYTGGIAIGNRTTLRLGAANVIPDGAGRGNLTAYGTLDLYGLSETINGLSGTGVVDNTSGAGTYTLSVGGNNATSTFAGGIQNTSGAVALAKIGSGTLTLTGTNTYSGATTVDGGTLKLDLPLPAASLWFDGTDTNGDGVTDSLPNGTAIGTWVNKGTLTGVNATQGTANRRPVVTNGAMNGNAVLSFSRSPSGQEDWLDANNSALNSILNASHTLFAVGSTNNGGADNSTNANQALAISPGWHNGIYFTGYPSSTGVAATQWLNGTGGPNFSSTGAYTQGTAVVADCVLTAGSPNTIQLFLNGAAQAAGSNTGTIWNNSPSILRIGAANTSGTYMWFLTGQVAEVMLFPSALSAASRQAVENYLMFKWLGVPLPVTSTTIIPDGSPVTLGPSGTLDLNNCSETIGSLAGSGNVLLGPGTLTTGGDDTDTAFSGQITGAGGLVKTGSGTFTLSNANSYTGNTEVWDGLLDVDGSINTGGGTAIVHSGGTLGGTGTIGSLLVEAGGTLAPGSSPGILYAQDVTMAAGSTFLAELAGPDLEPTPQYDQLDVGDLIDLGNATLNVQLLFAPEGPVLLALIDNHTSPPTGTFAGLPEGSTLDLDYGGTNYPFTLSYMGGLDGCDVVLTYSPAAVPEPATLTLLALGGLALLRRRRRAR